MNNFYNSILTKISYLGVDKNNKELYDDQNPIYLQGRFNQKQTLLKDGAGYTYITESVIWVNKIIKEFDKIYLSKVESKDLTTTTEKCFKVKNVIVTESIDKTIRNIKGVIDEFQNC